MKPPVPFSVDVSWRDRRVVVSPAGELDLATADSVREALLRHAPRAETVVLDLRGLEFMDTAGLRLIVDEQRRCRASDVGFALVRGTPHVQRLLDIAGLTPYLEILDDPEGPLVASRSTA